MLDELRECEDAVWLPLIRQIVQHVLLHYRDDRASLARALIWGKRTRAPFDFVFELASQAVQRSGTFFAR